MYELANYFIMYTNWSAERAQKAMARAMAPAAAEARLMAPERSETVTAMAS